MFALEIKKLEKTYPNGVKALNGIDLQVRKGDFFALLGPNGAGKSTAIGIISSLVNKTSGSVHLFGWDLERERIQAKSCLGVVPQEINFNTFERVLDIVLNQAGYYGIPRKKALPKAEYYLKKLGLWEKRNHAARALSGGMKRRLMIARGLIHEPALLILDEPTAGVDIELRHSMWEFLSEINEQGTTIILTTHYLEEAESLCRNVAIIDHGIIVQNSNMKALVNSLDQETIVLDTRDEINKIPSVDGFIIQKLDAFSLEIQFSKNMDLNELFAKLSEVSIYVKSLRNKTNRLEELFLRLVRTKS
jgi:ABC-2 type transport system ATP-binding protein